MFAARHQRVCVTTFCGAGSAWSLPGHSGMACQELCLEIPELGWCLLVSHRLVLLTYLPSLPRSLSASLIWFLSLPILPRISHPEPPTQPLSQSPSFHPIRNQVPWGEGWGSEVHSLRLNKNVFRHTVKTLECKSVEWKLCILASVPASVPLPGGREKTMCS